MPEHAQSDFISDRFLWETKDIRTTDIAYTIFITDTQILEIYIERILRDWSKGEVCVVFTNRNMTSTCFNTNLISHLNLHDHRYQEKLALMTDKRSQDSTLLQSCFVGDPDLTRWILKHTVDTDINVVNTCRNDRVSPLAIACEYDHTEIVEILLEYKADVNKCCDSGASPLFIACQNGHDKIVKILLTHGADINKSRDDDSSPLQIACYSNHFYVVEKLLKVQKSI